MTDKSAWRHTDVWKLDSKNFLIEVVRWSLMDRNMWNVYAYLYPKHPLFKRVDAEGDILQDAANSLPLHGGCTYLTGHYRKGELVSVQIGCDYAHLCDDRFYRMETKEEASEIFHDAEELFECLKNAEQQLCAD